MVGYVEVKEDDFEDTIEHLHRLKAIACKMIKKLSEKSEIYDRDREDDDDYEDRRRRKGKGRYDY